MRFKGFLAAIFGLFSSIASGQAIEPSYEGIQKAIVDYEGKNPGHTLTIPAILQRLPADFRSGFVLMHTSSSIQGSSYQAPRVIMFGQDARTILTFNGESTQKGNARLEFAAVNPVSEKLEYKAMEFPAADSDVGKVQFSGANPALCMNCHGDGPHYIWGDYAQWPGAYGSRDDVLELTAPEQTEFQKFALSRASHPRYSQLVFEFEALSKNAPFRQFTKGDPADRSSYQYGIEVRPNFRLSSLVLRHQARSRIIEMMESPAFAEYKHGLAFYLAGCESSVSDAGLRKKTKLTALADYAKKLGSDPNHSWHFELSAGVTNYHTYYSGIWTIDSLLSYFLWTRAFAADSKFKNYIEPNLLVPSLDKIQYKFFESPRGKEMWQSVEDQGADLKRFAGSYELKAYIGGGIDQTIFPKMCADLIQAQPQL